MQPDERRIIILDEIPGQDESDTSTTTKGRRTNRSSVSQLPKGSAGSTRQRASARPATSLTCPSEPLDLGQGGYESASSAVDTLQANSRGSNANSGGQLRSASGAVVLEPPPAERSPQGSGDQRSKWIRSSVRQADHDTHPQPSSVHLRSHPHQSVDCSSTQ